MSTKDNYLPNSKEYIWQAHVDGECNEEECIHCFLEQEIFEEEYEKDKRNHKIAKVGRVGKLIKRN
jgi:hypothetical protein